MGGGPPMGGPPMGGGPRMGVCTDPPMGFMPGGGMKPRKRKNKFQKSDFWIKVGQKPVLIENFDDLKPKETFKPKSFGSTAFQFDSRPPLKELTFMKMEGVEERTIVVKNLSHDKNVKGIKAGFTFTQIGDEDIRGKSHEEVIKMLEAQVEGANLFFRKTILVQFNGEMDYFSKCKSPLEHFTLDQEVNPVKDTKVAIAKFTEDKKIKGLKKSGYYEVVRIGDKWLREVSKTHKKKGKPFKEELEAREQISFDDAVVLLEKYSTEETTVEIEFAKRAVPVDKKVMLVSDGTVYKNLEKAVSFLNGRMGMTYTQLQMKLLTLDKNFDLNLILGWPSKDTAKKKRFYTNKDLLDFENHFFMPTYLKKAKKKKGKDKVVEQWTPYDCASGKDTLQFIKPLWDKKENANVGRKSEEFYKTDEGCFKDGKGSEDEPQYITLKLDDPSNSIAAIQIFNGIKTKEIEVLEEITSIRSIDSDEFSEKFTKSFEEVDGEKKVETESVWDGSMGVKKLTVLICEDDSLENWEVVGEEECVPSGAESQPYFIEID